MIAGSGQRTTPGKPAQSSQLRRHLRITVGQLPPAVAAIAKHTSLKNSKRASLLSSLLVSPLRNPRSRRRSRGLRCSQLMGNLSRIRRSEFITH